MARGSNQNALVMKGFNPNKKSRRQKAVDEGSGSRRTVVNQDGTERTMFRNTMNDGLRPGASRIQNNVVRGANSGGFQSRSEFFSDLRGSNRRGGRSPGTVTGPLDGERSGNQKLGRIQQTRRQGRGTPEQTNQQRARQEVESQFKKSSQEATQRTSERRKQAEDTFRNRKIAEFAKGNDFVGDIKRMESELSRLPRHGAGVSDAGNVMIKKLEANIKRAQQGLPPLTFKGNSHEYDPVDPLDSLDFEGSDEFKAFGVEESAIGEEGSIEEKRKGIEAGIIAREQDLGKGGQGRAELGEAEASPEQLDLEQKIEIRGGMITESEDSLQGLQEQLAQMPQESSIERDNLEREIAQGEAGLQEERNDLEFLQNEMADLPDAAGAAGPEFPSAQEGLVSRDPSVQKSPGLPEGVSATQEDADLQAANNNIERVERSGNEEQSSIVRKVSSPTTDAQTLIELEDKFRKAERDQQRMEDQRLRQQQDQSDLKRRRVEVQRRQRVDEQERLRTVQLQQLNGQRDRRIQDTKRRFATAGKMTTDASGNLDASSVALLDKITDEANKDHSDATSSVNNNFNAQIGSISDNANTELNKIQDEMFKEINQTSKDREDRQEGFDDAVLASELKLRQEGQRIEQEVSIRSQGKQEGEIRNLAQQAAQNGASQQEVQQILQSGSVDQALLQASQFLGKSKGSSFASGQEFELAKETGFQGSFLDFIRAKKGKSGGSAAGTVGAGGAFKDLTTFDKVKAKKLSVEIYGKRAGADPKNVNEILQLMSQGLTVDDIDDELRLSQASGSFSGAAKNAFGSITSNFSKDKVSRNKDELDRLLESGDVARSNEFILRLARNSAGVKEGGYANARDSALVNIAAIEDSLTAYVEAGGSTGILSGNFEKFQQKVLGRTGDSELARIANDISIAIQTYRKAVSGAAFTESEALEYDAIFPSGSKSITLNKAKIDSLQGTFSRNQDTFYKQQMGANNYAELFENKPQETGSSTEDDDKMSPEQQATLKKMVQDALAEQ